MQKIKCLLCEKEFKRITNTHLISAHQTTIEEYKKLFPGATIDMPGLAAKRVRHLKNKSYEEVYGKKKGEELKSIKSEKAKNDWGNNPERLLIKRGSQEKREARALERELFPPLIGRPRDPKNHNNSTCENCGREFQYTPSDRSGKFCCHDCYIEYSQMNASNYRIKAFAHLPNICDICNISEDDAEGLIVHHKDENPNNNDIENLQIVCSACHATLHKAKAAKYRNKFSPPAIERGVRFILHGLKVDIQDDNFFETPKRVAKAYREILEGLLPEAEEELREHLSKTFPCDNDQMIVVKNILCWSMCPHHLLPVKYNISIGYIPKDRVLGASKLPRAAVLLGKRPILQEQLGEDIVDFIINFTGAKGVGVSITGEHMCMQMRGIKTQAKMVTSSLRGVFLTQPSARQELMSLIGG